MRATAVNRNIRLLAFGVGIRMLGNALYGPFIALYLHNVLNIGYVEIGLIIVFIGSIQIPFGVVGGLISDRFSRKNLMLLGLASEALTTGLLAYAFSIESLTLAITAATVGGSISSVAGPAFSAYIADFGEGSDRTRGFTLFRIGFNAGYAAGVALGGLFISVIGFAGGVAVASAIIAASTVTLYFLLEPSPRDRDRRALVTAPASQSAPSSSPSPPKRTFGESLRVLAKDRVALEVAVAFALAAFVAAQWAIIFPLYVHNILGVSYSLLGAGLALNGLVVVFGQSATTESVIGWKHTTIGILGLALYGIAFVGLGAAGLWNTFPVAVFFVSVVVLTLGENLVAIPNSTLPSNLAPREEVGSYNGAFGAFGAIGGILATLAGGVVLALVTNPLLIWVILIAPAIPAIVLLRHAGQRIPAAINRA
ncbi:MAG: MFS transporter [Thermoplasmata archaeon]